MYSEQKYSIAEAWEWNLIELPYISNISLVYTYGFWTSYICILMKQQKHDKIYCIELKVIL